MLCYTMQVDHHWWRTSRLLCVASWKDRTFLPQYTFQVRLLVPSWWFMYLTAMALSNWIQIRWPSKKFVQRHFKMFIGRWESTNDQDSCTDKVLRTLWDLLRIFQRMKVICEWRNYKSRLSPQQTICSPQSTARALISALKVHWHFIQLSNRKLV